MAASKTDRETFLPIANACTVRRLRMLNRAVTAIYDEALRPHRVKVSQLNVLIAVAVHGPVRPGDLCDGLMLEKSTLSRNLDRIHDHGWIGISPGDDARSRELTLTRKGRRLLMAVLPAWQSAEKEVRALIGDDGAEAIHRMTQALDAHRH